MIASSCASGVFSALRFVSRPHPLEFGFDVFECRHEQRPLILEVEVHDALRETGRLGDPRNGRVREPVLGDRTHRGVDQLLAPEVGVISLPREPNGRGAWHEKPSLRTNDGKRQESLNLGYFEQLFNMS